MVLEVTDDKAFPKQRRKELQIEHAPRLSQRAKAVKLADKICNLRDVADSPPAGWELARKQEYFDWAKRVVEGLRGSYPALEARVRRGLRAPSLACRRARHPIGHCRDSRSGRKRDHPSDDDPLGDAPAHRRDRVSRRRRRSRR